MKLLNLRERKIFMSEYKNNHKYRMSGILAHPTSLPSPYGIGDMGKGAYDFVDFLVNSGQTLWQILPLGPTGYGDSPYQSFSAFAGQPLIISPELLKEDGLLSDDDLKDVPTWYSDKIDYGYVIYYKTNLFKKAFTNFKTVMNDHPDIAKSYSTFLSENSFWLKDYALYMSVKDSYGGASWLSWDECHKDIKPSDYDSVCDKYSDAMDYYFFIQFEFCYQWQKLKKYANERGIYIVGDIPIFVSMDSADAWSNKKYFKLDSKGFPTAVSGVPPDYFSATGQLWGNPLYDWDALKADNYSWWIHRIRHQLDLVDYLRIDHFRGFEAYWSVPYGEETAINGQWIKGPCEDFFQNLQQIFGDNLPIFAEDLGIITPEVEALRDGFGLPGMKILQFAFDSGNDSSFMPHHYTRNSICYTGTHDNDTTRGWYDSLSDYAKERLKLYINSDCSDVCWDLIRVALASTSRYAIIPITDILSVDTSGRMNMPGRPSGNWQWRFKDGALTDAVSDKLRTYTQLYSR